MANWSNPTLTSLYTDFLSELKARDTDLALQFDGVTVSNVPTGAIRWSSSANRWQKWNGSAWAELTTTYALTGLSTTGNASIGGTLSVTGATTLTAATATTPATNDNSTAVATTAYVRAQAYAPLASPALTGTPTAPTAAVSTNTTQLATTAFVLGQISNDALLKSGGTVSGSLTVTGAAELGATQFRAVGGEGGEISFSNPTNTGNVFTVDASDATTGRIFTVNNNTNLQLGQLGGTGGNISFWTAAQQRATIDSSGRLLVGQTHIRAGAKASSTQYLVLGSNEASNALELIASNFTNLGWSLQSVEQGVAFRSISLNPSGGNVGIGTTSPQAGLDVFGSARIGANNTQSLPTSSGAGGCHFSWNYISGSAETDIYNLYDNAPQSFLFRQKTGAATAVDVLMIGTSGHVFYVSGSERLRITSAGALALSNTGVNANVGFRHSKAITGATTAWAQYIDGTIQTDVTTSAIGIGTSLSTAASASLTSLIHYQAATGTLGAGTSLTNQIGFSASSTLDGATNDYGFYGAIAAGTGNWNCFMVGTAANYFAGQVQLGAGSVGTPSLATNGDTNTGIYWPASDEIGFVEGGAEALRLDSSGNLIRGASSAILGNRGYQAHSTGLLGSYLATAGWYTGASNAPAVELNRSLGSVGVYTAVASGDRLGDVIFRGANGTDFQVAARISAVSDGTVSSTAMPGQLQFLTTPSGSNTPSIRMRIKESGVINYANCPTYATDAAAGTGGLVAGDIYKTSTGELRIKL